MSATSTAGRPRADTLRLQDVLCDADLLFAAGSVRRTRATVGLPGAHRELQAPVVTVPRVDRPITALLAGGHSVPVDAVRIRGAGSQCHRSHCESSGDSGQPKRLADVLQLQSFRLARTIDTRTDTKVSCGRRA